MSFNRKRLIWAGIVPLILLVLIADQSLKIWVKLSYSLYDGVALIPGVLELEFVENPGMAFGWMIPGTGGKLALSIFRVLAVFGILVYLRRLLKAKAHRGLILCVGLIMAGAIGNILDSLFYGLMFDTGMFFDPAMGDYVNYPGVSKLDGSGYTSMLMGNVVDMLHFTVRMPEGAPFWAGREIFPPVFNIADSAITVGVIIILIRQKSFFKLPAPAVQTVEDAEGATETEG